MVGYRSTNRTIYSAKYHVIWCPTYRGCVLTRRVRSRLLLIIAQVVDEAGGQVMEAEVMEASTVGAPLKVVRQYVENQKRAA